MQSSSSLKIFVMGGATELGYVTVQKLVERGHTVMAQAQGSKGLTKLNAKGANGIVVSPTNTQALSRIFKNFQPDVIIELTPQFANTLLHDGQNWQNFDKFLPKAATALVTAANETNVKQLVYTSYAFLYGNSLSAKEDTLLDVPTERVFRSTVEAENIILGSGLPTTLIRMGYLYGSQSADLVAYLRSFDLLRPYYAGSEQNLANFLHYEDASNALVLLIEIQTVGETFNVVDGEPTSFGNFIDYFARCLGRARPAHIPTIVTPLLQFQIKPPQIELLKLRTSVNSHKIRQLGWKPLYPNYKAGLKQVVQTWRLRKLKRVKGREL